MTIQKMQRFIKYTTIIMSLFNMMEGSVYANSFKTNKLKEGKTINILPYERFNHSSFSLFSSMKETETNEAYHKPWLSSTSSLQMNLNGTWHYHQSPNRKKVPKNFYKANFDTKHLDNISNAKFQEGGKNTISCFRHVINIPSEWSNRNITLRVPPTNSNATLFINGKKVGGVTVAVSKNGIDVSRYIKAGKDNVIGLEIQGNDAELYRMLPKLFLEAHQPLHIEEIITRSYFRDNYMVATVKVDVLIKNTGKTTLATPVATLYGPNGEKVGESQISLSRIEKNKTDHAQLNILVLNPYLWNSEAPYLYTLNVSLNGDICSRRIGLQHMEVRHNGVFLAGRQIDLKSGMLSKRTQYVSDGNITSLWEKEIQLFKRLNLNAVFIDNSMDCDEQLIALCSHYGLYLIDKDVNTSPSYTQEIHDSTMHAIIREKCQNVTFHLNANGHLELNNNFEFTNLRNFRLYFTVVHHNNKSETEDDILMQGHQDLSDVKPGESMTLPLLLPPISKEGTTILTLSLRQKSSTKWIEAGAEIATSEIRLF